MRLIDANVLIYAAGEEHPLKDPCLSILDSVREGRIEANIDIEVLQEILHYYQRRREVELGIGVVENALSLFPDPLGVTVATMTIAMDILQRYPRLQSRDAVHVAVALQEGLEGIISTDRGFDGLTEIGRFDPADL